MWWLRNEIMCRRRRWRGEKKLFRTLKNKCETKKSRTMKNLIKMSQNISFSPRQNEEVNKVQNACVIFLIFIALLFTFRFMSERETTSSSLKGSNTNFNFIFSIFMLISLHAIESRHIFFNWKSFHQLNETRKKTYLKSKWEEHHPTLKHKLKFHDKTILITQNDHFHRQSTVEHVFIFKIDSWMKETYFRVANINFNVISVYCHFSSIENMSTQSTKINTPNETSSDVCQKEQKQQCSIVPKVEVVNEIQSVADKRCSLHLSTPATTSAGVENNNSSSRSEAKKCLSSRSSKTNLTAVTTPSTTMTLETTATATSKHVTILNNSSSRRTSREKPENSNVCGKLLKRVKSMLEKKDKTQGESTNLKF